MLQSLLLSVVSHSTDTFKHMHVLVRVLGLVCEVKGLQNVGL